MEKFLKSFILIFMISFVFSTFLLASDVEGAPIFPWQNQAIVTTVVLAGLGILSMVANKIPGTFGKGLQWLVDILSANIKHK